MELGNDNLPQVREIIVDKIQQLAQRLTMMNESESTRKACGYSLSTIIKGTEMILEFYASEDPEDFGYRLDNIIKELMEDKDTRGLRIPGVRDYFQIDYIGFDGLRTAIETYTDRQKAVDAISLLQMAESTIDRGGHYELDRYLILDVSSTRLLSNTFPHDDIAVETNITNWRSPAERF